MSSLDKNRCAKCRMVVMEVFPMIMQELMAQSGTPAKTLYNAIMQNSPFIRKLNKSELDMINTLLTDEYTKIDVSLSYKIIVNFFQLSIPPPSRQWGANPINTEIGIGEDIERIRRGRNSFVHRENDNISEALFDNFFVTFIEVGKRIDAYLNKPPNNGYAHDVEQWKTCVLDPEVGKKLLDARADIEQLKEKHRFVIGNPGKEIHIIAGKSTEAAIEKIRVEEETPNTMVDKINVMINIFGIEENVVKFDATEQVKEDVQRILIPVFMQLDIPTSWDKTKVYEAIQEFKLARAPDMNIIIKDISIDDLNIYAEIAKKVLCNVHKLRSEITKMMSTILSEAAIDTTEYAECGVNLKVPDISGGLNKVLREAEEDIDKLQEIPVHQLSSTHEPDGSVGEGVIIGRHMRPLSAPHAVPVSFYASTYRTVVVKYGIEAFPRLTLLLTRLNEFMDMVDTNVEQLPHIRFICDEQFASNLGVSSGRFAVHDIGVKYIGEHDVNDSWLTNTVCVIQPDESGNLSKKDKKVLEWLQKSFPEQDTKSVIFVINNASCTSSMLETCSKEISVILERFSAVNTIFNRLFTIESSEISVRISLFLEKNLLDKFPMKIIDIDFLEKTLTTLEFKDKLTAILSNSRQFMRRKTLECPLDEERTDRLPSEIQICKIKVNNYVCECLSQYIAIILEEHLKKHLRANNIDFDDGFDNIINRLIRRLNISISSIPMIFEPETADVSAASAKGSDLMFSVNVMDTSFRHSIADKLHESIMTQMDDIIPTILQRLDELFFKKVIKMCNVLNVFGRRNKCDVSFHAYKTITERNLKIKACGLFGNIIKVYIHNKEINEVLIRKYLCTYCADISLVNICEYQEINVSKHLLKSGNKVNLCLNSKAHYGTVGFPMKDDENRYYCATCKHVIVSSTFDIQTDDGNELPAEIHYRADYLDFCLLKIKKSNVVCHHGIRTEQNCFVSGEVLAYDMMPNEDDSVYKWGATTDLTVGKCKGVISERKCENENYDIETFIIQGENGQFSKEGDSGSLICITPDSIFYTRHMAAFILTGVLNNFEGINYTNTFACYRVSLPLLDMKKTMSCSKIIPCFSM